MKNKIIEDKRYLFVIVDRKQAKLLTFYEGALEEYQEIVDPSVPQKVKSNKGEIDARNTRILRHIEDHLHRHLELISKKVDDFVGLKPVHAVFIGGQKHFHHLIRKHLSPNLQKKIVKEFITELKIFQNKLIAHCEKAILQFEGINDIR